MRAVCRGWGTFSEETLAQSYEEHKQINYGFRSERRGNAKALRRGMLATTASCVDAKLGGEMGGTCPPYSVEGAAGHTAEFLWVLRAEIRSS